MKCKHNPRNCSLELLVLDPSNRKRELSLDFLWVVPCCTSFLESFAKLLGESYYHGGTLPPALPQPSPGLRDTPSPKSCAMEHFQRRAVLLFWAPHQRQIAPKWGTSWLMPCLSPVERGRQTSILLTLNYDSVREAGLR